MSRDDCVRCRNCRHFRNDAAFVERAFAGLSAMGSAWSSTRSDDGLCLHHGRHLPADAFCPDFTPKDAPDGSNPERGSGVGKAGAAHR